MPGHVGKKAISYSKEGVINQGIIPMETTNPFRPHLPDAGLDETLVSVSISCISRSRFLVSVSSRSRKIILKNSRSRIGLENVVLQNSRSRLGLEKSCFRILSLVSVSKPRTS